METTPTEPVIGYAVCDIDGDEHNEQLLISRRCDTLEEAIIVENEHPHWRGGIYREVDGVIDPAPVSKELIAHTIAHMPERKRPLQRVVVCAALRYQHPVQTYLITGARHNDIVMQGQIETMLNANPALRQLFWKWEQGFIDNHGIFMDRYEALTVAAAAGQINVRRSKHPPLNRLFSEDLY